jgi:hypothetical protein
LLVSFGSSDPMSADEERYAAAMLLRGS